MQPLRVAISVVAVVPDLMSIIEFLGKDTAIERIQLALNTIPVRA